ncbi:porin family protein [Rheinheimera maricola]|uniref:Tetratricopeptide repeat protein n=1 Tax=Rheinheimera maricola TaxID=2793282 RepID=A0ABS7X5C7_9GAMM|nr:porin family protein [Rheinheimera maricola]MBZ9610506.1 tetratricopeptide repeat protein [Rheinheimera maricola]
MTGSYISRWLICWLALLMLLPSMVLASSSASLSRLETLLKQQDYVTAWQLANELKVEQEGEPRFDFLFAVAARASGNLHQAVFALERALQSQPDSSDIRLALAVSYFELGNLLAAEHELQQLAKISLPDQSATLVQNYLQRIEKYRDPEKGYWLNWVQLGFGSDTNPNSGVDEEFIFIPLLGQVRLFEHSLEQDSSFYELQAQLYWIKPQSQHSAFYLSASVLHGEYAENKVFSRTYASAQAGYQTRWRDYRLSTELFYRPIHLDDDNYVDYVGVKGKISQPLWSSAEAGLDLTYARHAYNELTALDKEILLAEGWLSKQFGNAEHKVFLRWGIEDSQHSRTNFNSRDYVGLGYRWQQMLGENWMSSLSLDYMSGDYDDSHPLFEQVRDDRYQRAELDLSYNFNNHWRMLAAISHMRNDSNITIYQYKRTRVWIGVRYAF